MESWKFCCCGSLLPVFGVKSLGDVSPYMRSVLVQLRLLSGYIFFLEVAAHSVITISFLRIL